MTREFFKEICRRSISEILEGIPDGKDLRIYHKRYKDGEYIVIQCDGYEFRRSAGSDSITSPEGLNDED